MSVLLPHQRLRLTQLRARKMVRRHWPVGGRCQRCVIGRTCTFFVRACVVLEAMGDNYQPYPLPEPYVIRELVTRFRNKIDRPVF
ncbi:hypothetical protein BDK92_3723 [Micromonospora pisi]|uniref:Uncharacterized protein n=1 Tax=Micromonospora pisi TaxID=589240 RepID=A0A495JMX1_9ACTN|nr:hypothetical protein [Micromonospora pisi]RKR89033.1 hypothetical protein BDK92_3370 [Micromonospora pisi]RKR89379.1 hypothetical protein BDK92_3723 [Micromonospora pisi]